MPTDSNQNFKDFLITKENKTSFSKQHAYDQVDLALSCYMRTMFSTYY